MEVQKPSQFASNLKKLEVSFDSPKVGLPLRHVEVPTSPSMASAADAGIPDHDAATKRIVVLGHSMGEVISHTLVSSSQDRVWGSVFRVPPARQPSRRGGKLSARPELDHVERLNQELLAYLAR